MSQVQGKLHTVATFVWDAGVKPEFYISLEVLPSGQTLLEVTVERKPVIPYDPVPTKPGAAL